MLETSRATLQNLATGGRSARNLGHDIPLRLTDTLRNEELNDLYSTPNIVRVIKSIRLRWAGHVALCGRGEVYTGFWWGNLRERDNLEDPGGDGRIIL